MGDKKKKGAGASTDSVDLADEPLKYPSIGLESEFIFVLNDEEVNPKDIFKDPRGFIRSEMMHRKGTSFHISTGGIVYFDNGVIELATPIIEIAPGCAARAGRSLWEAIRFIREELDEWEKQTGNRVRLQGYSTHYNVSFELPKAQQGRRRTVKKLATLLVHLLPFPMMMLAGNPRSTGAGVRPRGNRIEITMDFTPSASLMIATATMVTGIIREVITWDSYELDMLAKEGLPVVREFKPIPHTTRKGWLARHFCFPKNPFAEDLDAKIWEVSPEGSEESLLMSSRQITRTIFYRFIRSIARVSDPFTLRMIRSIVDGESPALVQLPDRPKSYEDVGRLCIWENLFPDRLLSRSQYERVLIRAISGTRIWINGFSYIPIGMQGWTRVVFRREIDQSSHVFSIDYLLDHLEKWERAAWHPPHKDTGKRRAHAS
jgi:hypothetical protein